MRLLRLWRLLSSRISFGEPSSARSAFGTVRFGTVGGGDDGGGMDGGAGGSGGVDYAEAWGWARAVSLGALLLAVRKQGLDLIAKRTPAAQSPPQLQVTEVERRHPYHLCRRCHGYPV